MRRQACMSEDAPLVGGGKGKAEKQQQSGSNRSFVEEDDPGLFDTGFVMRELGGSSIRVWMILQIVGVAFTISLWWEVSGHLASYEAIVRRECGNKAHTVHGVCAGPMWNVTSWQEVELPMGHHYSSRSLEFVTHSNPPTFLVEITPLTASSRIPENIEDATTASTRWTLEVGRMDPPQAGNSYSRSFSGQHAMTMEDLSREAKQTMSEKGRLVWRASISARLRKETSRRFLFFVEDAAMPHLDSIHNSQCAFARSWKAFNETHQGHSHRALTRCQFLLSIFIILGGGAVYLVQKECLSGGAKLGGKRFHAIVLGKFIVQDIPQQVCIVLYVLGWYEAAGLRCQMCLFDPQHCTPEHPFHFSNAVAFLCVLLSSMSNQLLVRPVLKKEYSEDDICAQYAVRIGSLCVATLPFSTGICWASSSVLSMSLLLHVLIALPCAVGWLTFLSCICVPIVSFCDEIE